MAASIKDRFLIALAKFFGESPLRDRPLASLQLGRSDLMDEILGSILGHSDEISITREKFNSLMISCGHRLATAQFFGYFFESVKTIDDFERAVEKYRIKAMWLFGNFRFAYRELATCDEDTFKRYISRTLSISDEGFKQRDPFVDIEPIPVEHLHLLGYIAKAELEDLEFTHKFLEQLNISGDARTKVLEAIGTTRVQKSLSVMKSHGIQVPNDDLNVLSEHQINQLSSELAAILEPVRLSRENAGAIGERNTERYLTLPYLDVYVATSMRDRADFIAQHEFIKQVFADPQIDALRLRYFDPTLSYVENRITKGLIEMLMLRRARVTIYLAGAGDTLGKDSELAATLAQGKAVIVYVPKGEVALPCGTPGCERKVNYDKRAENFREDHPLGLQIAVATGVAHGIIVVRSPEECAKMLRKVMLRQRTFSIEHEKGVFLLRETETNSVVRVVTDDPLLTHAFWSYFNESTD